MAQNPNGHVIANYDVDGRKSGYGRGSDDEFYPDIEKLDGLVKREPSGNAWGSWAAMGLSAAVLLGAGLWARRRWSA